ncbi:MAG: deaminase [Hamadaea sp.]|uniref:dihydrofolate reductase family protein n=1 Tax=Hamadaea sp. TaxID=2024425 RepID=UPI00181CB215|nr:dihydrofolate reductase family protein [Hamadaea sp.]NUT21825.1 deaminase [Hamadaea sp.]
MGKIVITTNLSLDGVVEDPDGREDFRLGGWFERIGGRDLEAWAKLETEEALGATALLLGRRSDAWFAERWTSRTGLWADKLNSMPKYVVSATLNQAQWTNATVLRGDTAEETVEQIAKVKRQTDGEILVYASYELVRTLIEHDLADELRLVVFPVLLGAGRRLFGETTEEKRLRLISTQALGDGLSFVTYEVLR